MDYFSTISETVATALAEDVGEGDLTALLVKGEITGQASVITRETAIVCGRPWVDEVMRQVDPAIEITWQVTEGERVHPDQTIFTLAGPARSLLTAERTALNFLQTLSGTATRTRHYVDVIAGTGATLLDTRKTLPGLRLAQKYAVKTGGAENHRIGLYDAFLVKENHIEAAGSISNALTRARQLNSDVRLEVEVENLAQLSEAIESGPDWVMLDNFSIEDLKLAVERSQVSGIKLEASGGIEDEDDLLRIAQTGVDYISLGTLTKHCEAIDLSMRLE
jgi:nicotinate-nucleotide pyrophosphorylase (carboxylating)